MGTVKPNEATATAVKSIIKLVKAGILDANEYYEPIRETTAESYKQGYIDGYNKCIMNFGKEQKKENIESQAIDNE